MLFQLFDVLFGDEGDVIDAEGLGEFCGLDFDRFLRGLDHGDLIEGLVEDDGLDLVVLFEELVETLEHLNFVLS